MSHVLGLKCVSCGKEFSQQEIDYTCPACGTLLGTLDVIYNYHVIVKTLTRKSLAQNRDCSHWRYLPLLPIADAGKILPLAVGWTPLYSSARLASDWGLQEVWLKDDGRNPTASLKDRASSVAVVKALEKNAQTVTAASTGNAASSWSAFTALAGLKTVIFIPRQAPRAKIAQLLLYGATVLQVNGNYDDAFELCCQAAQEWGWYNRSTAINPYLGEGKKTAALEICEQLSWQAPDVVLVPVGDGCILQGMWKGFTEFYRIGLIDHLPKMIGVQAAGSSPLVQAWQNGATIVESCQPQTIADSIAVGVPRDQVKALRAVRESLGRFVAVSDVEILDAVATLAREVGVLAEPAAAAGLAGLKKLVADGKLHATDKVVVMVTGSGLKDIDGVMQAVSHPTIIVENSLRDVADKMKAFDK